MNTKLVEQYSLRHEGLIALSKRHGINPKTVAKRPEGNAYRSSGEDILRHQLFALYLPLARRIATRQYRLRNAGGLDCADIHQLACAGLLDAIDRFELDRGVAFRFYGNRRIVGSIIDGMTRMSEMREQLNLSAELPETEPNHFQFEKGKRKQVRLNRRWPNLLRLPQA